jgi:hypothetical protein
MGFLSWFVIAALLLSLFVITLMVGIYRRSLNTVLLSVLLCVFGVGASCVAAYKFFKEVHTEAKKALKGRSAMEMYNAVLGAPGADCVQILDYFDPVVPVMDDQLSICFKACPAEVERILARQPYTIEKQALSSVSVVCCHDCFTSATFGDTVLAGTAKDRYIYISLDSSHVFYNDIDN